MSETAPAIVRRTITAEHKFTDAERLEIAAQLAEKISERGRLEESKKNLTSQMKSEIDAAETEIELLSQKINTGKEFRDFFCRVEFDYDAKVKNYFDDLTGLFIKKEAMTAHDLQTKLALDEEAKEAEEESKPAETLGDDATLLEIVHVKFRKALVDRIVDMHSNREINLGCAIPDADDAEYTDQIAGRDECAEEVADTILRSFADVENDAAEFLEITGSPLGEFHRRLRHGNHLEYAAHMLASYQEEFGKLLTIPAIVDYFWPQYKTQEYSEFKADVLQVIEVLAAASAGLPVEAQFSTQNEEQDDSNAVVAEAPENSETVPVGVPY